jgi:hypothetical protein
MAEMNNASAAQHGASERTARKVRIGLLEKADLSTFIHETGHFYLEVLLDLADDLDAADWYAVLGREHPTLGEAPWRAGMVVAGPGHDAV